MDDNTIGSGGAGGASSSGLQPNVAALLAYLFSWVGGLVFILIEKENKFVRFHAFQSLFFTGAAIAVWILYSILAIMLPFGISGILYLIVLLGLGITWIILLVNAFQGKTFKLPVIGDLAYKQAYGS